MTAEELLGGRKVRQYKRGGFPSSSPNQRSDFLCVDLFSCAVFVAFSLYFFSGQHRRPMRIVTKERATTQVPLRPSPITSPQPRLTRPQTFSEARHSIGHAAVSCYSCVVGHHIEYSVLAACSVSSRVLVGCRPERTRDGLCWAGVHPKRSCRGPSGPPTPSPSGLFVCVSHQDAADAVQLDVFGGVFCCWCCCCSPRLCVRTTPEFIPFRYDARSALVSMNSWLYICIYAVKD